MKSLENIISLVKSIRINPVKQESNLSDLIKDVLVEGGVQCEREVAVCKGARVDLLTEDGVAIEVKRGKPNSRRVSEQICRYAENENVKAVILVSERGLVHHLSEANGKPVRYVALSHNWGMTV